MAKQGTWANLIRWLGTPRRRRAYARADFGDHGTAFGLDLSMAPDVIAPPTASPVHQATAVQSGRSTRTLFRATR
jgi:hypothetical protein